MADPEMRFDLTLKDADLRAALADVFTQAGRAFAYDDDVDGTVTVHAADLNFHDVMKLLLPTDYVAAESPDGVFHIKRAA